MLTMGKGIILLLMITLAPVDQSNPGPLYL